MKVSIRILLSILLEVFMKRIKQEQAVIIGTFISMLGQDLVNERIDKILEN